MQEKMWSESEYFSTLEEKNKEAYKKKLTLSSGMLLPDPYVLVNWKNNVSMMPDITWGDMYNYLINSPSNFTHDSMKAYKSLESYNFYICGHVQALLSKMGSMVFELTREQDPYGVIVDHSQSPEIQILKSG